jgi:hypothetical protein
MLLKRAMFGSMVLLWLRVMSMSMAHIIIKGYSGCPCSVLLPEAMLMPVGHATARGHVFIDGLCCHLEPC